MRLDTYSEGLAFFALVAALCWAGCTPSKAPEETAEPAPKTAEPAKRPNVLLITVDTLRADRLGCYGYEQARTPNIDSLAAEGVLVERAIAPTPITLPSHTTILTGLEPPAHGVRDNGVFRAPDELETIAEQLGAEGYRTQAFVSAEVLHRRYGLDQGFDGYDDVLWDQHGPQDFMLRERPADRTIDQTLQWLEAGATSAAPFFLWVHLFDPHQPYAPPASEQEGAASPYDGEITFADQQLGRLFDALRKKDALDDTIVVFTSDHGESLGEHGESTHAIFIYESTVRVPLILRYPSKLPGGRRHSQPVRSADLVPTILGLVGLAAKPTQGADLSAALAGEPASEPAPQYSESLHPELSFGMAPLYGIRSGDWTYIRAPRAELYNRASDPGELENLLDGSAGNAEAKERAAQLDAALTELVKTAEAGGADSEAQPLDEKTVEMLRALGYMVESEPQDALRGMDPKDGIRIYAKIDEAFDLIRADKCSDAVSLLKPVLKRVPTLVVARNVIARCSARAGDRATARKQYLKSLSHDGNQPEVLLQLSRLDLSAGDAASARKWAQRALEIIPASVDAMVLLAVAELGDGNVEGARQWYERAIEADPGRPDAYVFLAESYFSQKDFERAKQVCDRALAEVPGEPRAALLAGMAALHMGDPKRADTYFVQARENAPGDWQASYWMACSKGAQGDARSALALLRQAVGAGFSDARLLQRGCFALLSDDPQFESLTAFLASAQQR